MKKWSQTMSGSLKTWLLFGVLLGTMTYAIAEDMILTTYYPSPRGVYRELRTSGDVYVGDLATPAARLHVVQPDPSTAPALRVDDQTGDASPFIIEADGDVGIGTTTPTRRLDVAGSIRGQSATPVPGVEGVNTIGGVAVRGAVSAHGGIGVEASATPGVALWAHSSSGVAGIFDGRVDVNNSLTVDNQILTGAGTPAAPAYSFLGDTNTGMRSGGADNLRLVTAGSDRLTIASSGNVGIADTTPAALLTVGAGDLFRVQSTGHVRTIDGTAASPAYAFTGATNTGMRRSGSELRFTVGGTDRMWLNSSGQVRGATYGFGGMFVYVGNGPSCWEPNPITGGCSCPAGFTMWHIAWVNIATGPDSMRFCYR